MPFAIKPKNWWPDLTPHKSTNTLSPQGGILSSAAVAFLMAAILTRAGPIGRLLWRPLSTKWLWKPLAQLSYSAYLYHEQARRPFSVKDVECPVLCT